jgi:hypothetical protein
VGIVDDIMAGSFAIRQSKTILARFYEARKTHQKMAAKREKMRDAGFDP